MPDVRAPLKLNQNAVIGALLDPRTADPSSFVAGQVWFRSDLNELRIAISGAAYITFRRADIAITNTDIAAGAAIALSKLATDPLARANHTGTQLAATISDFIATRDAQRLDQHAVPNVAVAFGGQRATGLADPTSAQDAATKAYVDGIAQGLDVKGSVKAATTANLAALSGPQTIDGVALVATDRVLVKDQTAAENNGIYTVAAGAWARSSDGDTWNELVSAFTFVEQGTTNADSGWVSTVDQGGSLGSTAVSFSQFSGGGSVTAGNGLTKTGNTLDVGAGTGIAVAADAVAIDTTVVARKFSGTITGNAVATTFNVDHNLGNTRPQVTVWEETSATVVEPDVLSASGNRVTIGFGAAPANGAVFTVIVVG